MSRSRSFLLFALSLFFLASLSGVRSSTAATISGSYVPGEVIVKYVETASGSEVSALSSQLNAVHLRDFPGIGASLEQLTTMTVPEAIALLENDPLVEYIEPNYLYTIDTIPNDPDFGLLWGMNNTGQTGGTPDADIDAPEAWDQFTGSTSVIVGVIDTGVDYNHPDLAANIWTNPGEIAGNGIDDDNNGYIDDIHGWDFVNGDNDPMDDNGHGSHCSGTIGGVGDNGLGVAGVNWHVKIMALKFLSAGGSGSSADAISCVEYATMMGVDLTSNSWGGGGFSTPLEVAIQDAYAAGVLFVAAAGNSDNDNDLNPSYPASYTTGNIIAVGATDHNDNRVVPGTWGSNFGLTSVDIGAPGLDIYSTVPGGGYSFKSGTSMAAPHVSGVVALIRGQFPNISVDAAKILLFNSADPLPQLAGLWVTGARVNAAKAMTGPDSIPPFPVADLNVSETASNWVSLAWTASGDDGADGTAQSYDIRYSVFPLDDTNFDTATAVADPPDPGAAGQPESVTITGLDISTSYYFALKVRDEYGNTSLISNLATTTTLAAPTIAVSPGSLAVSLITGEQQDHTVTISNVGAGVLDFDARGVRADVPGQTMQAAAAAVVADITPSGVAYPDEVPITVLSAAETSLLRSRMDSYDQAGSFNSADVMPLIGVGGTYSADLLFSLLNNVQLTSLYTFVEVDYEFDDLSGLGGLVLAEDDAAINLAEATVLRDFYDSGRGIFIGMDDFDSIWYPPVSDLLEPVFGISAANDADFCASAVFNTNHPINDGITDFIIDGAWCNENDEVSLAGADWLFMDGSQGNIFGVANDATARTVLMGENLAFIWSANEQLNANAVIWLMAGAGVPTVNPSMGTIAAGGSLDVTVTFDASGLCGDDFYSDILVSSNDPVNPEARVSAVMTVTGMPDIDLSDTTLTFGQVFVGAVVSDTLIVSNHGCDVINVTAITIDHADFSTDLTPFSLAVGENRALIVSYSPIALGAQIGTLSLTSNDPDQPVVSVGLSAEGLLAPVIAVSPASLTTDLVTGEIDNQLLTVSNTGANDLIFDVSTEDLTSQDANPQVSRGRVINATAEGTLALQGGPVWSEGASPARDPLSAPITTIPGALNTNLALLLISNGYPVEIQAQLLAFSDVAVVDIFDASIGTPSLTELEAYHAVILTNGSPFVDPIALGDVLADYVDAGGGVVQTIASFVDVWVVKGRFLDEGYGAFDIGVGPVADSSLGAFDANHPIMNGVTAIEGALLATAPLAAGAQWVADWSFGEALVATQGASVAGVNIYVAEPGYWTGDLPLLVHNTALWVSGAARWLDVDPTAGVVPAGTSQDLLVTFDATGICSGTYLSNILIDSNDPLTPLVTIPADMNVTGEPDVAVSDTLLAYGPQFIGAVIADSVRVTNIGCELLSVTAISIDHADFTTDLTPFTLAVDESRLLTVLYAPTGTGAVAGTLSLTSNDPGQPLMQVALTGEGLVAPVIQVSPNSLSADLPTGGSDTRILTISNTGGNDLVFHITTEDLTALGEKVEVSSGRLLAATAGLVAAGSFEAGATLSEGVPPLRDPLPVPTITIPGTSSTDMTVLIVGNGDRSEIQAQLLAFSDISVVDLFDTDAGTPTLAELMDYRTVILANNWAFSDPVNLGNILADYVDQGGGVVQTEASFTDNWTLAGRFMTDGYSAFNIGSGPLSSPATLASFNANHFIMSGVSAVTNVLPVTASLAPGAQWVADWDIGEVFVATQGDRVVGVNGFVADPGYWTGDMPLVLHNALAWAGGAAGWLDMDPIAGTVVPGASLDVLITFDAANVCGGLYTANILIDSNDPLNYEVAVPASMTVTGVPDIAVSDTLLAYGPQFVGAVVADTLVVSNPGCDLLTITAISIDNSEFDVDVTPFSVADGEAHNLVVYYHPTSLGSVSGILSLTSNDPDQPLIEVSLTGEGVTAPVISVDPDVLDVSLVSEEIQTRQLTIANSGGSDLTWRIQATKRDSVHAVIQAAAAAVVAGLEPSVTVSGDETEFTVLSVDDQAEFESRLLTYRQVVDSADVADVIPTIGVGGSSAGAMMYYLLDNVQLTNLYTFVTVDYSSDDLSALDGLVIAESDYAIDEVRATAIRNFYDSGRGVLIGMDDFDSIWNPPVSDLLAPVLGFGMAADGDLCANAVLNTSHPINEDISEFIVLGGWCSDNDHFTLDTADWLFMDSVSGSYFGVANEGSANSVTMGENLSSIWLPNEQLNTNAIIWMMKDSGLPSATPSSGVIAAGSDQIIDVTFDATGICGGDFPSDLVVSSNDPVAPEIVVAADMHVIGAPVVDLPDTLIAFGEYFIGFSVTDSVMINNLGCGVLEVSSVTIDNSDFTANAAPFTVPVEGTYYLPVVYTPSTAGPVLGTLTLATNDPLQPTVAVSLTGTGCLAPVAGVAPDQLAADLQQGETEVQTLTLTNTGAGELSYSITAENVLASGQADVQVSTGRTLNPVKPGLKASVMTSIGNHDPRKAMTIPMLTTKKTVGFADGQETLTREPRLFAAKTMSAADSVDVQLLLLGSGDLAEIQSALLAFPSVTTVDIFDGEHGVPTLAGLTAYNVVILANNYTFLDPVGVGDVLADYVDIGGGVIQTEAAFVEGYEIAGRFMDDGYAAFGLATGPVGSANLGTFDSAHPIMDGVTDAYCVLVSNTILAAGAAVVANWDNNRVFVATNGDRVVGVNAFVAKPERWTGDVDLVLYNTAQWIAGRVTWLDVTPMAGTVPPGGSVDLTVTFAAGGNAPGDYSALIQVNTNDPVNPVLSVAADLTVRGVQMMVDVAVTAGAVSDLDNTLGIADGATDGFDGLFDVPEPPSSPGNFVTGYFSHPEWESVLGERFMTDIRAPYDPGTEMKTWPFVVETDLGDSVTMAFTPSFGTEQGWQMWLRDEATGGMYDLFPSLTHTFLPGAGPHEFTIYVGQIMPPLDPTERQITSGWSLIGVPLVPLTGADTWDDVVLGATSGPAYLYNYNGATGYGPVGGGDPVTQAQGVWLATTAGFTWTMQGNPDGGTVDLPAMVGWNLVGYPLWVGGDLAGVSVQHDGQQYLWQDAVNLDLVSPFVYDYDDSTDTYLPVSSLQPWHGYWMAAHADGVTLQFNYRSMLGLIPQAAAAASRMAWRLPYLVETVSAQENESGKSASDKDVETGWQLNVGLAAGVDQVAIGRTASATTGFDAAFDLPVPPTSPSNVEKVSLIIRHPEWELASGSNFYTDLVSLTSDPQVWNLTLTSPEPGAVTLQWDPLALPDGVDLQVYLPQENRVVVMSVRVEDSVRIDVGADPVEVRFRTPDSASDVPFAVTGLQLRNIPNPFNPMTEFRFNLPRSGEAEIRIFDVRGAMVHRVSGGVMSAGPAKLRWAGRDGQGRGVASGIYFYRLYLDERQEGPTVKMTLVK